MVLKSLTRFLLLSLISVLGLVIGAHTASPQKSLLSDQCIMCHVESYSSPLQLSNIHQPFFERKCPICHMPEGAESVVTSTGDRNQLTGGVVTQVPLWRKQQVFGGELSTVQHQVTLRGLDRGVDYRFRLVMTDQQSSVVARTLWLGFRPKEFQPSETRIIYVSDELSGNVGDDMEQLILTALDTDTMLVSWDTRRPLFSQLELQKLEGQDLPLDVSVLNEKKQSDQHPQLRSPEDLAIEACYQCHPESTLGTSHPVKLYGGKDVLIPDELPTVDGMLTCVTCHDPHGADGKMLVREIIKTKLCVTCHYKFKNSSPSTMFQ